MKSLLFVVALLVGIGVSGYRPVILMHGILSGYSTMETLSDLIKQKHPGTQVLNVDAYNDAYSLESMWTQVDGVMNKMKPFLDKYVNESEGFNMLCYSQGGLVCRGILQKYSLNIHTFISLSSPQAGQFGSTEFLKYLFPNITRDAAYLIFYSDDGQKVSAGDYWNDPFHQDLYKKYCHFLSQLNSDPSYKENFLNIKQLVLVGGPDDGVITPWQSSQFGFYESGSSTDVIPRESQIFYKGDLFGLKTLSNTGRLKTCTKSGVNHVDWPFDTDAFEKCMEPWLQ